MFLVSSCSCLNPLKPELTVLPVAEWSAPVLCQPGSVMLVAALLLLVVVVVAVVVAAAVAVEPEQLKSTKPQK